MVGVRETWSPPGGCLLENDNFSNMYTCNIFGIVTEATSLLIVWSTQQNEQLWNAEYFFLSVTYPMIWLYLSELNSFCVKHALMGPKTQGRDDHFQTINFFHNATEQLLKQLLLWIFIIQLQNPNDLHSVRSLNATLTLSGQRSDDRRPDVAVHSFIFILHVKLKFTD